MPGMSQIGGLVAVIAVVVAFLGFNFERPVAPHLVLAVSFVGLAGGCLIFLIATWLIAPQWASDACLEKSGEAVDALVRMIGADGGGGWRLDEEEKQEQEEEEEKEGSSTGGLEEEEEDAFSSSPSTFLGASGEPSSPRIPPRLKRLFQKKSARRRAAAEAKGTTTATATATTNAADEEVPPPLPTPTATTATNKTTPSHRAPAPGYNRPAPLAGRETLSAAATAWAELSASLVAAEALLKPAAGEAFWGHASLPPRLLPPFSNRPRRRFRVLTPALPPPLWPLRLRRITKAHVVSLRAGVEELAAALQQSARLCWLMRSLSSSQPLSRGGPVAQAAREVYLVPPRREGGGSGSSEKRGGDLLAEWQSALEAAAAAAARAVPRSFSSLSPFDSSEAVAGDSSSLASALAALRRAAEALSLARERASASGAGGAVPSVALLLSRAAEDEAGEGSFAEEARFGAWEGGVAHAVANAERVGRAVEALRGMMPK